MPLLKKIFNKLNGLKFSQEYLCLSREDFTDPLKIILKSGNINKDITAGHAFIGYKPLIIAIPLDTLPVIPDLISADFIHKNKKIASLKLRLFHKLNLEEIAFYESKYGSHRFITSFHQFISGLYNSLYNKKSGNVYLKNNLLKQVQIA